MIDFVDRPQKFFKLTVLGDGNNSPQIRSVNLEKSDVQVDVEVIRPTGEVINVGEQCLVLEAVPIGADNNGDHLFGGQAKTLSNESATATFSVVRDQGYVGQVFPCDDGTRQLGVLTVDPAANGGVSSFFVPLGQKTFSVGTAGETIQIELTPSDATLSVQLLDEGNASLTGFVTAYSGPDFTDSQNAKLATTFFRQSRSLSDGSEPHFTSVRIGGTEPELLALLSGRKYTIKALSDAFLNSNDDKSIIPSEEYEIYVVPGDNEPKLFRSVTSNHSGVVNLTFTGDQLPDDQNTSNVFCNISNREGQFVNATNNAGIVSFKVHTSKKVPTVWSVHCEGVFSVNGTGYFFSGSAPYKAKGKSGSVNLELSGKRRFYSQTQLPIDNTMLETKTLQDDRTLVEVPAGAFGSEGTSDMQIESGSGYLITDAELPLLTFDFTFIFEGEQVTKPASPVRIWFPIDLEELQEKGATIDDVYVASYDPESNIWTRDATFTIEERDGITYVVASVTHFSLWGALVSLTESEQRATPVDLKVKAKKAERVKFTWTAPENATEATEYELQYVKYSKKLEKFEAAGGATFDYSKVKTKEVIGDTKLRLKLKNGTWKWRVRVKDGSNPSTVEFKRKRKK
jgi:hypothetical protein